MAHSGECTPYYTPNTHPTGATAARLVRALDEAIHRSALVEEELKEAVCAYVAELWTKQLPPEGVLIAIKHLIGLVDLPRDGHTYRPALVERVVHALYQRVLPPQSCGVERRRTSP